MWKWIRSEVEQAIPSVRPLRGRDGQESGRGHRNDKNDLATPFILSRGIEKSSATGVVNGDDPHIEGRTVGVATGRTSFDIRISL